MSAIEPSESPDQRAFTADANAPSFKAGVLRQDWTIDRVNWPIVQITIAAAPRKDGPDGFMLRCDFTNYPAAAPTATPWDVTRDAPLTETQRPKGEDVGMVFRSNWEEGRALYCGYDRVALAGHPNWMSEHPNTTWTVDRDLTWWVSRVWDLLNSDDYEGI